MNFKKSAGVFLLVVGLLLLILSLTADLIRVGGSPGFGPNQSLGSICGAIAAIVGAILTFKE